ncbi:PAS domain-containing protein [Roseiconus nitratireducens]|nr:PAS domain-containing protein [Roseiconus nitratireducens]
MSAIPPDELGTLSDSRTDPSVPFRLLADSVEQLVWMTLPDGQLDYANRAWVEHTGLAAIRKDRGAWKDAIHPEDRPAFDAAWQRATEHNESWEMTLRLRHRDGGQDWFVVRMQPIADRAGRTVCWFGICAENRTAPEQENTINRVDPTAAPTGQHNEAIVSSQEQSGSVAAQEHHATEVETLRDLHSLSHRLKQSSDLKSVARETLETLIKMLGADMGSLQYYDSEAKGLRYLAHQGFDSATFDEQQVIRAGEHWLCSRALESYQRVIVEDFQQDLHAFAHRPTAERLGYRAAQSTPLIARSGKVVGMVTTCFREPRPLRKRELRLIDLAVQRIAYLMEWTTASDRLRDSEQRFHTLADNMSQLAWMADENGWIFWYNQRWYDYTGTTLEQMRGWGWKQVHHPEHVDAVVRKIRRCFQTGENWEDTFPLRGKDGLYRWFLSRAVPIRDEDGRVIRWFGTNTDVTELRRIERELRRAREAAEQANRAKSDFLANMSHEIRSPMTAILGYIDLLTITSDADREMVETIRRNSQFLLELINDILDLSKIEAGKLELDSVEFHPRTLVEDVVSLMQVRAAEHQLKLGARFDGPIPNRIQGDPVRIRQILINLVGNAIKFTDVGEVGIAVSFDGEESQLRFDVHDTGIGMRPDQLERLFQPFEQADSSITRQFGGSGLGLAISQRLAELLGARITVTSELGKGSQFSLIIPLGNGAVMELVSGPPADAPRQSDDLDAEVQAGRQPDQPADPLDRGRQSQWRSEVDPTLPLNARVLVVDDRRDIRFLVQHVLRNAGAETVLCEDGAQAVATVEQSLADGQPFDLVVMDMQMPIVDGITAVGILRDQGYDRPVIALTANAMNADREKCLQSGFTDYLSKPIDVRQLLAVLHRHVAADGDQR